MSSIGYFGTYARFQTDDKEKAIALLNADNIIGSAFTIEHVVTASSKKAWIVNPFGKRMGFIDEETASKVDLCTAKGWTTVALLALVAFTEDADGGHYWGEVAVISYDPAYESAFSVYREGIARALGDGIRPNIDLGRDAVDAIVKNNGDWIPSTRTPLPPKEKGTAFVKTQRGANDRLIEQARTHKIGCTVISWIIVLACVTLIVVGLHSCGIV